MLLVASSASREQPIDSRAAVVSDRNRRSCESGAGVCRCNGDKYHCPLSAVFDRVLADRAAVEQISSSIGWPNTARTSHRAARGLYLGIPAYRRGLASSQNVRWMSLFRHHGMEFAALSRDRGADGLEH